MNTIAATATAWHHTASAIELRAFEMFHAEGCKSCGDKATPGCACWRIRMPRYVARAELEASI